MKMKYYKQLKFCRFASCCATNRGCLVL